jgi:hypothetical protein
MIQLQAHPLSPPPSPVSKLDRRHTGRLKKRGSLLTGEGEKGAGAEPNHTIARNLTCYKPFNTLCHTPYRDTDPSFRAEKVKTTEYAECQAFVQSSEWGRAPDPLTRKRVLLPLPPGSKRRQTLLRRRELGDPIRTTVKNIWCSVYYNPFTVKTIREKTRSQQSLSVLLCVSAD